jgi:ATP-dependent RNA helicase RhlE
VSFSDLRLHPDLLRNAAAHGYSEPTPIQVEAIPPALEGCDLLACAQTGSGKTAAFLLPVLHHLLSRPRGATRALVLSPTRELAAQIAEELRALAGTTGLRGAAVFGGVGMAPQRAAFEQGVDVIVATPGRLLDHFSQPYARLASLEMLVLDEADRMLDMGFLPSVKRILARLPARRQTLFFSATLPREIEALTRAILRDPVEVRLGSRAQPAAGVAQSAYRVPAEHKAPLLAQLLQRGEIRDALVFTRTKHRADRLAGWLVRQGVAAARIHGNRSQNQRTQALDGFKRGRYRVLVATDLAARGIDVEALGHVVNFDVPAQAEDYVHRVGRTGRAEARGDAITLVSPPEEADFARIERTLGLRVPRLEAASLESGKSPGTGPELRRRGRRGAAHRSRVLTGRSRRGDTAAPILR